MEGPRAGRRRGELKFAAGPDVHSQNPAADRALPRLNDNKHLAATHGLSPSRKVTRAEIIALRADIGKRALPFAEAN
jgi:hypothetical protein